MIQVVNVIISDVDKEKFLNLSITEKAEWIKNHTVLKDEERIYQYLSDAKYPEVKDCISCGSLDNKIINHGNISKTNAVEVTESNESAMVEGASAGNSDKRSTSIKAKKKK